MYIDIDIDLYDIYESKSDFLSSNYQISSNNWDFFDYKRDLEDLLDIYIDFLEDFKSYSYYYSFK